MNFKKSFLGLIPALLMSTSAFAELKIEINPSGISADELNSIQIWLSETESKFPPAFQNLNRTITLEFNPNLSGSYADFYKPFCPSTYEAPKDESKDKDEAGEILASILAEFRKKSSIMGRTVYSPIFRTSANRIQLNPRFIPEIVRGRENSFQYPCSHKNYYDLAQATLLHEIMHIYDFSESRIRNVISDDEHYQVLAGWYKRGVFFPELESANSQTFRFPKQARSADPYEFESVKESAAVNFEYFILDPNFACRKPGLYRFYSEKMGFRPYPETNCDPFKYVAVQSSTQGSKKAIEYYNLDTSRLYQVHYLLADQGSAMMSRWGHSMFRLVYCSPRRRQLEDGSGGSYLLPPKKEGGVQYVGPDCMRDGGQHLIVSYRAHVTEPSISSIKGLRGKYPSQMFMLTLLDVINEYTVGELRDVLSYPLILDADQKNRFIDQVMDQYWGYQGRYFFLSNNCAVESMNLVKAATGNTQMMSENISTPKGLTRAMKDAGLLDDSMFAPLIEALKGKRVRYVTHGKGGSTQTTYKRVQDPAEIEAASKKLKNSGHFYRSKHWDLANDYEGLKALSGNRLPWEDVKTMMQESSAEERMDFYNKFKEKITKLTPQQREQLEASLPKAPIPLEGKLAIHMYAIEEFIAKSEQTRFMKSIGEDLFLNPDENGMPLETRAKLDEMFDIQTSNLPWMRTTSGYGIPSTSEVRVFEEAENKELAEKLQTTMKEVQQFILKKYAEEAKPVLDAAKNFNFFRTEVQQIKFNNSKPSVTPSPTVSSTPVQLP